MATYLDFEQNIKKLEEDIHISDMKGDEYATKILKEKLDKEVEKTFSSLSDYQKLQLARHADRPYALDYVKLIMHDYHEIHGDRHFSDDGAIIAYLGYIGEHKVVLIGEQKGRGTKMKLKRNFGMPNPEGYRKALRVIKLAEKFSIPIVMLIDTPGAYPGLGAEERSQSEAIAKNLFELSGINTPTISVVIGEGGSGGALAIGVADKLAMLRYSVFSVISPEGCAAILWNDPSKVEDATNALKVTAEDLKELNLIDDVIDEPLIGAHRDKRGTATKVANYIIESIEELSKLSSSQRNDIRYKKLLSYGEFAE